MSCASDPEVLTSKLRHLLVVVSEFEAVFLRAGAFAAAGDHVGFEHDGHVQTGLPLHADVTAFLLARGADRFAPATECPSSSRPSSPGTG
jgi:hypothetical protein